MRKPIHYSSVCLLGLLAASTLYAQAPMIGACPALPADNVWNAKVDALPLDSQSSAYVTTIGATKTAHADFGAAYWNGAPNGIPFVTVPGTQPPVAASFTYADESDPGPYPIPANAPVEGGTNSTGDRHVLVIDQDNCVLYELYSAYQQADGSWKADSGAVFRLKSNALRPAGWTSADAAGLPVFPGLVRYDEVASGEIRHAIRFTAPQTRRAYIWPGRHYASTLTGTQYPPMGQRFRLKASFDISSFSQDTQVILRALKTYGMILADNGSSWFLSGAPDSRWNDTHLSELSRLTGNAFEAVDESSLIVDPNSGQVKGSTPTAPVLSSLGLNPTSVTGGTSSTGQATLTGAAPSGGVVVTLSSSAPAVAAVPASVTVAAGATSANFTITTAAVSATTSVTITAVAGGVTKTALLTVNPTAPPPFTVTLTASPTTVVRGGALTVSWQGSSTRPTSDVIGLFAVSASNSSPVWSRNVTGAQNGSFSLTAPYTVGQYEFRYLNGGVTKAKSAVVTVKRR